LEDVLDIKGEAVDTIDVVLYSETPRLTRTLGRARSQEIVDLIGPARQLVLPRGHFMKGEVVGELSIHFQSGRVLDLGLLQQDEGEGRCGTSDMSFMGFQMADLIAIIKREE
jgi:hypothetical protein